MRDTRVGCSTIRRWVLQFEQEMGEASGLGRGEKEACLGTEYKNFSKIWETYTEVGGDYVQKWLWQL